MLLLAKNAKLLYLKMLSKLLCEIFKYDMKKIYLLRKIIF